MIAQRLALLAACGTTAVLASPTLAVAAPSSFTVAGSANVAVATFRARTQLKGAAVVVRLTLRAQTARARSLPLFVRAGGCDRGPQDRPTCPPKTARAITIAATPRTTHMTLTVPAPDHGRPLEVALTRRGAWRGRPLEPGLTIARLKLSAAAWIGHPRSAFGYTAATNSPFKVLQLQGSSNLGGSTVSRKLNWFVTGPTMSTILTHIASCRGVVDGATCSNAQDSPATFEGGIGQASRSVRSTAPRRDNRAVTAFTLASAADARNPFIRLDLPN